MNRLVLPIFIILTISIFAIFPRLYKLNQLPPSYFADEIDAGYQADYYNQFGTDYYGNRNPIHFHSFADWRTSLYIYSIAFTKKFITNSDISIRLPSAIFGIISIAVIYLITKSPTATILLAISPWAIHYSRTGFEASGMLLCILLAIYFWQKYFDHRSIIILILAIFWLSLSVYFYSTAKLFAPLLGLYFLYSWRPSIKHLIFAIIVGLIFQTPMIIDTFTGHSGYRFSYISIFTEPHREQITDNLRYQDILVKHFGEVGVATPPLSYLFHNKYQLIIQRFVHNYLATFSTDFLFISGDKNIRQGFGNHGVLYYIDFFVIIIGLFYYFRHPSKLGKLFLFILFIGPIPFALTRDSDSAHATRLILILPSLIYFSSLVASRKIYILPIYLLLFINFWHYYEYHYPQDSARAWHANSRESVLAIKNSPADFIYFSDQNEPFLPFFAYYYPYLPGDNLTNHLAPKTTDYFDGRCLDNRFCFGHLNTPNLPASNKIQVVVSHSESVRFPTSYNLTKKISKQYINSDEFDIYTNY